MRYSGINIDTQKPSWMKDDAEQLLNDYYLKEGETIPQAFARASIGYCFGDYELAQRIYNYVTDGWFMFSSPILSNALLYDWKYKKETIFSLSSRFERNGKWLKKQKASRGMPISCFLSYVPDNIEGQFKVDDEMSRLSVAGGGVGLHLGMRGVTKKSPGAIPYTKVMDSNIMYYKQGETRKGAVACYLDVGHPDIVEFLQIRKPTGGDENRKAFNIHNAVNITEDFMLAVKDDSDWDLVAPNNFEVTETVKARALWENMLDTRYKTGEPYLNNITYANEMLPKDLKAKGLKINGSNLCNEIHLPTDEERTAVCCLSSVNLAKYDEWKDTTLIADLILFLDNVIEYFIIKSDSSLSKARYSAMMSRDLGLGAMGWHEYLQKNNISFESGGFNSAIHLTNKIFGDIRKQAEKATFSLACERGACPDAVTSIRRNMHLLAIAPNANSSIILGTSPSIEPWKANAYMHKTRIGTNLVKNPALDRLFRQKLTTIEAIEEAWDLVLKDRGSVQGLDFLTKHEKDVFKTFDEINQMYVIAQARHRQAHLCQGQSVNLAYKTGATKAEVNKTHAYAFNPTKDDGVPVKGLYYLRTEALRKGEDIGKQVERDALKDFVEPEGEVDCLSCEG